MNTFELEVSSPNPMQLNVDPIEEIEVEIPDFIVTSPRDYNILDNKPKINNVTLIGNKTSDDLGLLSKVPTAVDNNVVIFTSSGKIGDSGIAIGNVLTKSSIINNLTSTATDAPLSAKMGKELNDIKVDKVAGKGLSTNDFTDALKNKLDGIETGAQVNKLEKIFVNGNEQTIFPGKKVDISVPTKTSDITNDSGYINKNVNNLVNYTKTDELADVALSGNYNDLSNKPTIPTKTSQLTNDSGYINRNVNNLVNYTKTDELADVALSGNYNDLSNKPTISDASIVIKKNGNPVDSFSLNQLNSKNIDISGVEETSNKVTTLSQSSTNAQYPSAKVVYDVTEEIREIAAGKTKNYACSAVTNPELNSQADAITLTTDLVDISGTTIPLSSLKLGDNIYLTQTDLPDRWYAGNNICYKLETSKVPVTDVKRNGVSVVSNTVADVEVPTKTSDITNDSGFINKDVNDLTNYPKTTEMNTAIANHHDNTKQDKIDSSNKLSSDLVNDTNKTNKFVTQEEKNAINTALQPNDNVSALQNDAGYLTEHQSLSAYRTSSDQDIIDATKENTSNKITSISSASTNTQYPSAKCVYDIVGNIEATLQAIRGV